MPKTVISKARLLGRNILMKPSGRSKKLAKSERNFQPLAQVQWNINLESLQTQTFLIAAGIIM